MHAPFAFGSDVRNSLALSRQVYGYGGNVLDQNLYYLGDKNQSLLYCSAAVVVVYDPVKHTQKHFLGGFLLAFAH